MAELTARSSRLVFGLGILGAALLGACAHGRLGRAESEDLRRSVPTGSTLELLRSLPVAADAWSVCFQSGSLVRFGEVELNRPYCELFLGGTKGEPWEVQPARLRGHYDSFGRERGGGQATSGLRADRAARNLGVRDGPGASLRVTAGGA